MNIHKNMSLREALRAAQELGLVVTYPSGTDEVRIYDEVGVPIVTMTVTRKDAGQRLTSRLRRIAKRKGVGV